MQEQLKRFFDSIKFTCDSEDFCNATISKVVLNKKEELFEVFIENDIPINPVSVLNLIKASKNGIEGKGKCHINFVYDDIGDDDILEAFKVLLGDLIIKRPSLVSLENKNISIDDDFITIELDSKSEEYDMFKKEIKGLGEALIEMGMPDTEITTAINVENEKKIQEEIEADRNKKIEIEFYEPEPSSNGNGNGWVPKKKVDFARGGLVTIASLEQEENNVHLEAYIFGSEFNQLKSKEGKDIYLITLKISDNTSSILAKCFAKDEKDFLDKSNELKDGKWFSFKGQVRYDNFAKDLVFNFRSYEEMKDIPSFKRIDDEEEKRVELHAHTMMSQMDGVCDEVKLVKQAMEWGHRGIAITDHDCCQSFPHVFGEVTSFNKGLKKKAQAKIDELKASLEEIKSSDNQEGIAEMEKMIEQAENDKKNLKFFKAGYGTEIEVCEDYLNVCFNPNDEEIEDNTFVVFDTETTGFNPGLGDSMIEIGGVKIRHGEVVDRFDELINPGHHIDEAITRVTDISDDDVKDADNEEAVVKRFKEWIGNLPLVAHNAKFDKNMLDMAYYKYDLGKLENPIIDTLMLSRVINRDLKRHSLAALGKAYGIDTGEVDEEEENVSESNINSKELDSETGSNFKSIKVDGEEILNIVKEEYVDIDIATEERVTKYRNRYYLNMIHKASKTEEVNIEVEVNDNIELIDFDGNYKLHPAENDLIIKYSDEFGDKELEIVVYVGQHHGADVDSENTGYIFNKMLSQIKGINKLSDLNNLGLLEEISFRNNPKYLEHIGDLISYKNYVFKPEENQVVDENLGYPFEKYGNMEYRWKYPWCKDNYLQMYENIPGKTFTEHIANIYDFNKHITMIAKDKTGLKNMFKIVSYANTNFINRNARLPRKILEDNREGLLFGSACLNGEIFNIALTRCDEDLVSAMNFYDYIEVQPPENYSHLLRGHDINNEKQLEEALEKIIRCAKKAGKIVVATGDVHNINKEDRLYREIIVNQNVPGKGRHPLARYLSGYSKRNSNEENINKCINAVFEQGIEFKDNELEILKKVLKYIYVLTKIKKIPINALNIASIYVPKGEKEDIFKGKDGEAEKLKAISTALRKLKVANIIQEKEDSSYYLVDYYTDSEPVREGHIPNQYFRTTKEMKKEFDFLEDKDLIDEIVVKNPNKILDMLEEIEVVVYPDKPFSPVIEHSQETCRDLVFDKAHSMYGDPLPRNIEERIAQEFYGDKISDLVKEQMRIEYPKKKEEKIEEEFPQYLHKIIMSGYDGVVNLKKDEVLRNNPDMSEEDAIKEAKAKLTGIIGGGFDVIYLIAQKLVKHSNDDGYLVGSRGSVGSSFVASMMGITECNGLPAHYYCPKCQHSEFNDDEGIPYSENYPSGFDLPEKKCPKCGEVMIHQGNDMPFATFLGFAGEKVPDIDLNFSGDNQASAHDYTKVLFGTDNVYRAGTIGTVADKTAIGYVQGYYEEKLHDALSIEAQSYGLSVTGKDELKKKGIIKSTIRFPEVERISVGCTGVKRTTGQHPGGIVVVPGYKDIWDFTPFQYPADDQNAAWRTTHFDYHAIDADLLKLDILGHDDPTVLRMLQELAKKYITHGEDFDVTAIDLGDPDTMKIFTGPEILGVDRYKLRGSVDKDGRKYCPTGTLGVPEFGTQFLLGMLEETKPTTFAELIKISGLSHGTDVWLGNARDLCTPDKDGKIQVPFKNVIGCRDDIMVNLIQWGMNPAKAFKIMEFVRKGKASKDPVAWADHANTMKEAGIPDWYIESCRKIKYMFPKAHATAYVTSAFRIAWFKVHYPILYYCAYLSIRRDQFDIKSMIGGADAIRDKIDEIDEKGSLATNKDQDTKETLLLCLEMCLRGFYFKNIDVDKSDGKKFVITEDEKGLIIPFRALDGLGDNVADAIVKARESGPFISIEDLMTRGKINGTSVEKLRELGCLDNLSESNQLSLF